MIDATQAALDALLPCPFCNGKAELWRAHYNPTRSAWIACVNGCIIMTKEHPSDADAIAVWNTRSIPATAALLCKSGWTVEKAKCENCRGRGRKIIHMFEDGDLFYDDCPTCKGTGDNP